MVASTLEEVLEAVAQGDVVTLQERGIVHPVVGQSYGLVGCLEVVRDRGKQTVGQIFVVGEEGVGATVSHTGGKVVEHVIAQACTEREAEVPVLPLKARSQTHQHRCVFLFVVVFVGRSNHTVAVAINHNTLNGLAVLVVSLLIDIIGISGMTDCESLYIVTRTERCTTLSHIVVAIVATSELGDLVVVVGEVVVQSPVPVLCINSNELDGSLETSVGHRTDVLCHLIAEVGCRGDINRIEQVGCLAIVPVEATADPAIEESPVKTQVIGCGLLPCQVGLESVRTGEIAVAHYIIVVLCARVHNVVGNVSVVGDTFLLTGHTPTSAELQIREPLDILKGVLILHLPHESR